MKRTSQMIRITRTAVAALVLVLLIGTLGVSVSAAENDDWKSNLLIEDLLEVFDFKRECIGSVTFLDDVSSAPQYTWNLGKGYSDRVKGWVVWEDCLANIYIAADGGINGELSTKCLFEGCINLKKVSFGGAYHTETAKSMSNMFYNCYNLESVDTENLDTSNVTSMYQMFRDCHALENVDISNFDTSNVTSMYCMFAKCYSLKELDLQTFDTSKVTNMGYMFSTCRNLEKVNLSKFDTSKVTYMEGMLRWCEKLEEPDLSGWDVSNVTHHYGFMDKGMTIAGNPWEEFFN